LEPISFLEWYQNSREEETPGHFVLPVRNTIEARQRMPIKLAFDAHLPGSNSIGRAVQASYWETCGQLLT
jgi:hypothetical protein